MDLPLTVATMLSFFGIKEWIQRHQAKNHVEFIIVIWGTETLYLRFPGGIPNGFSVGDLRRKLADKTFVPIDRIKLFYQKSSFLCWDGSVYLF